MSPPTAKRKQGRRVSEVALCPLEKPSVYEAAGELLDLNDSRAPSLPMGR